MVIKNEKGNLMLMVLLVFLAISIMGTSLIAAAGMENKMVINDKRSKQALLAADAGLEIARSVIIDKLKTNSSINEVKNVLQGYEKNLGTNLTTTIEKVDFDKFNSEGEVTITSVGTYQGISKKVTATLKFENMPSEPIRADTLRVAGRYYEEINTNQTSCGLECNYNCQEFSEGWGKELIYDGIIFDIHRYIAHFTNSPRGKVEVKNGDVAYNHLVTDQNHVQFYGSEFPSHYFTGPRSIEARAADLASKWLSWTGLIGATRAEQIFHSGDFLRAEAVETNIIAPNFTKEDVAHFHELAKADPEQWDIWEQGTFRLDRVKKPFNYIESNLDNSNKSTPSNDKVQIKVNINFWTEFVDWLNFIFRIRPPQVPYWQGDEKVIVIVSNDNLEVIIDGKQNGKQIDLSNSALYLLSSSNINFINKYNIAGIDFLNTEHRLNVYALAGENLTVDSNIKNLHIEGSLQANNILTINMLGESLDLSQSFYEFFALTEDNRFNILIDGEHNKSLIDNFPFRWSFLGVGKTINYKQE